jgi:prevent-host-death family protein
MFELIERRAVGVVKAARSGGGVRKVQTSKAKVHLPQLLRDVERGETLIITRHGRMIARIVPVPEVEVDRVVAGLQEVDRRRGGCVLRPAVGVGRTDW